MKYLILLGFLVSSCEGLNIRDCSYACMRAGKSMIEYSSNHGCKCSDQCKEIK